MTLRSIILKDFWLKLFSVVLAALIWLTVSFAIRKENSQEFVPLAAGPSRTFDLPVLVVSAAADVREFRVSPDHVQVTVQAEPAILEVLQEKDIRVLVDLTDIESARNLRKRVEVSTPPGVTHRVVPEYVEIRIPPKR